MKIETMDEIEIVSRVVERKQSWMDVLSSELCFMIYDPRMFNMFYIDPSVINRNITSKFVYNHKLIRIYVTLKGRTIFQISCGQVVYNKDEEEILIPGRGASPQLFCHPLPRIGLRALLFFS